MLKRNKRIISVALVIMIIITLSTTNIFIVSARAPGEIGVQLDGRFLAFDVPPMIINGRTMVPFRVIFEALGLEVNWDAVTNTASGTRHGLAIELPMNSTVASINGQAVSLEVPAITHNSRTLVPLRFVAEASGANVIWNSSERLVIIETSASGEFTPPSEGAGYHTETRPPVTAATPEPPPPDYSGFERAVLDLVNIERANNGIGILQWGYALADSARAHSMDMVQRGFFNHICPDGISPFDRMDEAGISWRIAAENIASGQRTPEAVMNSWMNSPGHRANILNPSLSYLGVGFYNYRWTQKFSG